MSWSVLLGVGCDGNCWVSAVMHLVAVSGGRESLVLQVALRNVAELGLSF